MANLVTIKERQNPFEFHASEFLGDVPSMEHLYELTDAPVGALCYVINTGYTYLHARPGDWKQLKAGRGTTGKTGPQGLQGPPGRDGRDGQVGPPGETGPRGHQGEQGEPGRDGVDGKPGKDGRNGTDGIDGNDGRDGKDGIDGVGQPGPPGPRGYTGTSGEDGRGWTGAEYDPQTGIISFYSDDGLEFQTPDIRGTPSPWWAHLSLERLALALKPYL